MLAIRPLRPQDIPALLAMIQELAEFEHLPVTAKAEDLERDAFDRQPGFRGLLAEWDNQPAGYALFYEFYSTFRAQRGLFLEDLFVRSHLRGKGIGRALLAQVAAMAVTENYFSVRWEVLDWNKPAIKFYEGLDAVLMDEWRLTALEGNALRKVASGASR